ncbi:MAG TPA: response regulator [Terriglobales bacterium]
MQRILVVDDDEGTRTQLCRRLGGSYEVLDTGNPEQALSMALELKPDAVVLDVAKPPHSGFELCQSLRSLSYTARIPVFLITERAGRVSTEQRESVGATAYFDRPLDVHALQRSLKRELEASKPERRDHVRVRMRVMLKLRGNDAQGKPFEELTSTENVSAGGFLCNSTAVLAPGAEVEVFLAGDQERFAGRARMVRRDSMVGPWQRYGFQFDERTAEWILQS